MQLFQNFIVHNFIYVTSIIGLIIMVLFDYEIDNRSRRLIVLCFGIIFLLMVSEEAWVYYVNMTDFHWQRQFFDSWGFFLRPILALLLVMLITPHKGMKYLWIPVILNCIAVCISPFNHIYFYIDENNIFGRGPLGYASHVICFALLLILCLRFIIKALKNPKREDIIVIVILIWSSICSVVFTFTDSALYYPMLIVCLMMYYIYLRQRIRDEKKKEIIKDQRIKLMITQIKPHFLFNTLTTIQVLCKRNPEMASETIEKLAGYVRNNIDLIDYEGLAPLEQEIEHTKLYTEIEMQRFPNIRVEYDIDCYDILLPPLTIQPIVENAIRHGVRVRDEGIVKVSSYDTDTEDVIVIEDNGKGFDFKKIEKSRGSGVGLKNVKERIESMVNGKMTIESVIDKGTVVTIKIPRE